ncbi:MAG: hypothetical protein K8T10_20105 [Candidatus Eremiobacteraeota bacterium]|nr:hypothetical protein [Candidatus Eremiobacteraeota bacterium]
MKILVIDPDSKNAKVYGEKIIKAGAEMELATSAYESTKMLRKLESFKKGQDELVGIIVSELLPDISGELFKAVLTEMKKPKLPPSILVKSINEDDMTINDYIGTVLQAKDN